MRLKQLIPMLNVLDINTSLDFYQRALGFEIVSDPKAIDEWCWATIRSGQTELMLAETGHAEKQVRKIDPQQDSSWPVLFYFYPDNVAQLHQHVLSLGLPATPIITTIYGMKEFSLQDPDGHVLSFGEDAEA